MRNTNLALIKAVADNALGTSTRPQQVSDGVSSDIYRIMVGGQVAYLKLSGTEQASLYPEYLVYQSLSEIGVRAPRVLYYAEEDRTLGRSVLILSCIDGSPIRGYPASALRDKALEEAGCDLAQINQQRVNQYGWINFARGINTLEGDCRSLEEFVLGGTLDGLNYLYALTLITTETRDQCLQLLAQADHFLMSDYPHLLHGDFGSRHLFSDGSRYTGMIDFGNIRGGSLFQDLAHLRAFDRQFFAPVLRGYRSHTNLPVDAERIIAFESMTLVLGKVNWIREHRPE